MFFVLNAPVNVSDYVLIILVKSLLTILLDLTLGSSSLYTNFFTSCTRISHSY
jgi:hypothetical protein